MAATLTPADLAAKVESGTANRFEALAQNLINQQAEHGPGFDADAAFTANQQARADLCEVIGQNAGLAKLADGTAAYVGAKPAWHNMGKVFGEPLHPREALKALRADFGVITVPSRYTAPDGTIHDYPGKVVHLRDDTLEPLSITGDGYEVFTHTEVCDFLEALFGLFGNWVESAAFLGRSLTREHASGAEKLLLSAKMPEGIVLDPGGRADWLTMYVNSISSIDGRASYFVGNAPIRNVCGNAEGITRVFGKYGLAMSWKSPHKSGLRAKVSDASEAFGILTEARDAYREEAEAMIRATATVDDVDAMIAEIWGSKDDAKSKAAVTKWNTRRDLIIAGTFEDETQTNVAGTAWGAFNGFTWYQRNHTETRTKGTFMTPEAKLGILTVDEQGDGAAFRAITDKAWKLSQRLVLKNR